MGLGLSIQDGEYAVLEELIEQKQINQRRLSEEIKRTVKELNVWEGDKNCVQDNSQVPSLFNW